MWQEPEPGGFGAFEEGGAFSRALVHVVAAWYEGDALALEQALNEAETVLRAHMSEEFEAVVRKVLARKGEPAGAASDRSRPAVFLAEPPSTSPTRANERRAHPCT